MSEIRCQSPLCITHNGVRGRMFTPSDSAEGISKIWCTECIKIYTQIQFFSSQTVGMIQGIYQSYINTNLPKQSKLILEQFAREIIMKLGGEL